MDADSENDALAAYISSLSFAVTSLNTCGQTFTFISGLRALPVKDDTKELTRELRHLTRDAPFAKLPSTVPDKLAQGLGYACASRASQRTHGFPMFPKPVLPVAAPHPAARARCGVSAPQNLPVVSVNPKTMAGVQQPEATRKERSR